MLVPKNLGAWPTPPTWPRSANARPSPCPWCYRPATARVGRLKGTSQPRAGFRSGKSRQDHGKAPARLWGNYSPEKPGEGADHVKITSRTPQGPARLFVTCWPEKAGQRQNLTVFLAVLFQDEKKESFIHAGFERSFDSGPATTSLLNAILACRQAQKRRFLQRNRLFCLLINPTAPSIAQQLCTSQ